MNKRRRFKAKRRRTLVRALSGPATNPFWQSQAAINSLWAEEEFWAAVFAQVWADCRKGV